jgi:hypothetical protein
VKEKKRSRGNVDERDNGKDTSNAKDCPLDSSLNNKREIPKKRCNTPPLFSLLSRQTRTKQNNEIHTHRQKEEGKEETRATASRQRMKIREKKDPVKILRDRNEFVGLSTNRRGRHVLTLYLNKSQRFSKDYCDLTITGATKN